MILVDLNNSTQSIAGKFIFRSLPSVSSSWFYEITKDGNGQQITGEWEIGSEVLQTETWGLDEGEIYFLELRDGESGDVLYRDRLYCTSNVDPYTSTNKDKYYTVDQTDADDRYIILED